jgi:hypothetical protein
VNYRLNKELLSTEMGFWRRTARTCRKFKVRNEVITEKWEKNKLFWKKLKITR